MQPSLEEPLPRVVVLTGKAIREYFEEALTRAGASLATWVVLYGVERGGWDNQRNLAKDLRIEGATLTRHLDRMERDGLIVRTRDPRDRRQFRVTLTPTGRTLYRRLKAAAQKTGERATDGLSEEDQANLRRILGRIRTNVGGADADERSA
jgi:MarR family transcriptional regulator, transcriptional regulator for hemolysin